MANEKAVSWLVRLEKGQRAVAMCIIAILAEAGVIVTQYMDNKVISDENRKLNKEYTKQSTENEQKLSAQKDYTASVIAAERRHSDSLLSVCEQEKQAIYLRRIPVIKSNIKKMDKILSR